MRIRLADYVANFLADKGVRDCFTVVGGGAMHLNDAFGHHDRIRCTYNHHEQASAIAAESYARLNNEVAVVCVTTGPGGTNAITGVVGGWLDSIPMFIVSGQVRHDTTARYAEQFTHGLKLRSVGDQEYDIISSVAGMCKYAATVESPNDIGWMLEKAWKEMQSGRKGPVWIDIPVDYQGTVIETDELKGCTEDTQKECAGNEDGIIANGDSNASMEVYHDIENIDWNILIDEIKSAKRPVIYAGGGIRLSGGYGIFRTLVDALGIPVVTYWNSIDLIETDHPLYCGRGGNMGDRAGNFAVQNADLIIALGTRISIRQVGYNWKTWARCAKVIMVNIDEAEFYKPTIHVDTGICADVKDFMNRLYQEIDKRNSENQYFADSVDGWREQCLNWKKKYPCAQDRHYSNGELVNVYAFIDKLSIMLPDNSLTAVSNGACCVVGHQCWNIKKGTRFIINSAIASMGYGLPAAIGLCIAGNRQDTVCLEGDGSIMMNLQELQTVVTNRLPIKLFLINNNGYHSIRQTQSNLFSDRCKVGIGPESNDLSFPDFKKIAEAFGWPYIAVHENAEMETGIDEALNTKGYVFCEVFTDTVQYFEPKSSTKRLEDGGLFSPPLEDMAPFLSEEELEENMYIPVVKG